MKNIKRILVSIVLIAFVFLIVVVISVQLMTPDYKGTKYLDGLTEEVEVYYDTYGVPHIYGKTEEDAFKSLGYVHAQDRLWQMEVLRRIGSGRLSELFGSDLIETDRLFLTLGIDASSKKAVAQLDTSSPEYKLSLAYLEGVNKFVTDGTTPVEFYLTGLEKTLFELKDIYNILGYMSFSFAVAQRTDPLLSNIYHTLGADYLNDLEIDFDPNTVSIPVFTAVEDQIATLLEKVPAPQFIGSNAWVIGAEKTKNGEVIFANDPHIGYAQPSVWFEAHIETPQYENYGYHLAGIPFPLLAHNRKMAYGLTMFENDDIDFYQTQSHVTDSNAYLYEGEWLPLQIQEKQIKVKDANPILFQVKSTLHGPLMNDVIDGVALDKPLSMSWVYTQRPNKVLNALYSISHAADKNLFKIALPNIHAPGLNVMYGDREGNIAWWATAALYELPSGISSKFVLDGSTAAQEKIRFTDFSENPMSENPPWNYVYSANNAPLFPSGKTYPGYYLPENRAKRIVTLLDSKRDWDKSSVSEMILDHTSSVNAEIIADFNSALKEDSSFLTSLSEDEQWAYNDLQSWEGDYPESTTAAALFHKWEYYFLKAVFLDELGETQFKAIQSTHFFKRAIAPMAKKAESIWFDNSITAETETKADLLKSSFKIAFKDLSDSFGNDPKQWNWGKIHTVEHEHPIGKIAALRSFFNVGPFPISGSKEVINNTGFSYTESGGFKVNQGPSTRRVIDFSDIEHALGILPTGQSGNPFSAHYEDQAQLYRNGGFRTLLLNKAEIKNLSTKLVLKPAK